MSKQTAEPRSAAGAEEKSSTGVLDAPEVDRQTLKQDHETAKQSQKGRLAGLDSETSPGGLCEKSWNCFTHPDANLRMRGGRWL